ncbi:MAG: gamma-glutamyltransferase family protein [Gemmatimonadota bacterium]
MATGYQAKPGWATSRFAVAAANPLATDAGFQILDAGGSAVDAAIAVQMVLTLVEPQSSGIGGGAFLLHWDGTELLAWNGRETAPAAAHEEMFLTPDGTPLPYGDAVASGLSVGVPGTVAMLEAAHRVHGRLPWQNLFIPAITLASEGFPVSPRLRSLLAADSRLLENPLARELYFDEQLEPHPVGHTLHNPALAEVLRRMAQEGSPAFYQGPVAADVAARVQSHPERPGELTSQDLSAYPDQDFQTDAICTPWREYSLCGFPPPSSGHLAALQILGIMEAAGASGPENGPLPTADWLHLYLEASKLAFADRDRYVADPNYVEGPGGDWETLLDPEYLTERALLMGGRSMGQARPGNPAPAPVALGSQPLQPEAGTSHISIVDARGNAVSMTTTIESGFGSGLMSDGDTGLPGGFHLNNELTDFSLSPRDSWGQPIANRVEAGKRPRSSMTPTLVFHRSTGAFVASLGSPGGAAIIHYTTKALVGMLAWGLNAQEAIDLPNFANFNGPSLLESGRFSPDLLRDLRSRGHEIREADLTSGLQAIQRAPDGGLFGGADPRREGIVMGR